MTGLNYNSSVRLMLKGLLALACICTWTLNALPVSPSVENQRVTASSGTQEAQPESSPAPMPRYGYDNFLPAKRDLPPELSKPLPIAPIVAPVKPEQAAPTVSVQLQTPEESSEGERPPYRLQIGDTLLVSIYGENDTDREVTVDSSGMITYPIIGKLSVVGRTIDDVRHEMNQKIEDYYRFTFVNITPSVFGGQNYTILGQVFSPGTKSIVGKETVLTALARAGGFPSGLYRTQTIDFADLSHAFLARNGQRVPVDFEKLVYDGDLSQDVDLQPGDYIYIPSWLDQEIYVLGEVRTPGPQGFMRQATLIEAITLAGGITQNASSRAMIVRGSLSCPINYYIDVNKIMKGCAPDFILKPGDIVYMPPRQFQMLRDIYQMAVSTFVSGFFSEAASLAYTSVTGNAALDNFNIIPPVGSPVVVPVQVGP